MAAARSKPKRNKKRSFRRVGLKLCLLAGSLAFALLVAELALRFVFPQAATGFSARLFTTGEKGLTFLKPGAAGTHLTREFEVSIRANGRGYRDREWSESDGRDGFRVLFLGDSFVFGWGVERDQSFVSLLQRDTDWAIHNAGIPGDGFPQYQTRAELHVPELRPDVVVLCVYVNDFTQLLHPTPTEGKTAGKEEPLLFRLKKAVASMHVYRLAYRFGRQNALLSRLVGGAYHDQLTRDIFREEFRLYDKEAGLLDDLWPKAREHLARIRTVCDRSGARLIMLGLPPSYLVDGSRRERLLALTGIGGETLDFQAVTRRLRDFCREANVAFVDPADALAAAIAKGKRIYFPIDMHVNAAGHELLAGRLKKAIEE